MPTRDELRARIRAEREAIKPWSTAACVQAVREGRAREAHDNLIFFTPPAAFPAALEAVRAAGEAAYAQALPLEQRRWLAFAVDMAVALASFLPAWNLRAGLSTAQLEAEAQACAALAERLSLAAPEVAQQALADWRAYAKARFEVEKAADPGRMAGELVGPTVGDYVRALSSAVRGGYLRPWAEAFHRGETMTELGNDYAAFLDYAMYLGVSFATTNPPLVDLAWTGEPERWNAVIDRLIADDPKASDEELARRMTLQVVLVNMRLLRPIFLLTEGRLGLVSLQVNPKKHGDADAMIADATALYRELEQELNGVPNVVFKLPATNAGLTACRYLNARGMGTNATVNFGLFQEIPFAEATVAGNAVTAYITEMNGRLAFPVRDELLAKADSVGISADEARYGAAWAGVAVQKKLVRLLKARNYDLNHLRVLVASLRWYVGAGYERLSNPCPDVIDCMGTTVITIFPNIRHALDITPNLPFDGHAIETPVPEEALKILEHSEIFRQSYWLPGDDDRFRPARPLTLADEAETAAWAPVAATLNEFCNAYDSFVARIAERRPSGCCGR
ncbi:MAG: transaldolase family protein [Anaerolineae bacterium]